MRPQALVVSAHIGRAHILATGHKLAVRDRVDCKLANGGKKMITSLYIFDGAAGGRQICQQGHLGSSEDEIKKILSAMVQVGTDFGGRCCVPGQNDAEKAARHIVATVRSLQEASIEAARAGESGG